MSGSVFSSSRTLTMLTSSQPTNETSVFLIFLAGSLRSAFHVVVMSQTLSCSRFSSFSWKPVGVLRFWIKLYPPIALSLPSIFLIDIRFHSNAKVPDSREWWQDMRQQLLYTERTDCSISTGLCPAVLPFAVALYPTMFGRDVDCAFSVLHSLTPLSGHSFCDSREG